ncbi:hypothetical protein K1T71_015294 [Dendrolimus kikuchii]|nr:hypothetical protein K1T71_015294 [Dendrolimus kikuchii]
MKVAIARQAASTSASSSRTQQRGPSARSSRAQQLGSSAGGAIFQRSQDDDSCAACGYIVKRHANQLLKFSGGKDYVSSADSLTSTQSSEMVVPAFILPSANGSGTRELIDEGLHISSSVRMNISPNKAISPAMCQPQTEEMELAGGPSLNREDESPLHLDEAPPVNSTGTTTNTPQKEATAILKRQRKKVNYKKYF